MSTGTEPAYMSPLSAGRTCAVAGAVVGILAGLVLALLGTAVAALFHVGYVLTVIAGAVLVCAVVAFVGGVLYAAVHNLVADWTA